MIAIIAIIGYTTIAIAGNGTPKIQEKSKANKLLQEKVSFISHKNFEVSPDLYLNASNVKYTAFQKEITAKVRIA